MAEAPADPLVVDSVEAGYFRDVPILNGASLRVGPGEMVTIVGPNGAGKSTLVRVVIGLLEPWVGTVRVEGERRARCWPRTLRWRFAARTIRGSRAAGSSSIMG